MEMSLLLWGLGLLICFQGFHLSQDSHVNMKAS